MWIFWKLNDARRCDVTAASFMNAIPEKRVAALQLRRIVGKACAPSNG